MRQLKGLTKLHLVRKREVDNEMLALAQLVKQMEQLEAHLNKLQGFRDDYRLQSVKNSGYQPSMLIEQQLFQRRLSENISLLVTRLGEMKVIQQSATARLRQLAKKTESLNSGIEKLTQKCLLRKNKLLIEQCDEIVRNASRCEVNHYPFT